MRLSYFCILSLIFFTTCKSNSTNPGDDLESPAVTPKFACIDGLADNQYPCDNIDLLSIITPEELIGLDTSATTSVRLNDIWGWTDPQTGKEYALVGLTNAVSFVDVSDPGNPIVIGKLDESDLSSKFKINSFEESYPACTIGIGSTQRAKNIKEGSTWRDMKVFNDHMFVVSDAQPHGMQSFDLTKLRNYEGSFLEFFEDALYDGFGGAHNIVINEETGFAYATGVTQADTCGSRSATGLHIIDINAPNNPSFAGCFFDPDTEISSSANVGVGYIHDAQCVNYNGPDSEHVDKEVCFSSAEGALVIADVTNKSETSTIGFSGQSMMQYSHQGWLTEDQSYFLMNDELDERNLGRGTKTYVWDVRDLENPEFVGFHEFGTGSIDHNLYIKDNLVYASNYRSGLRVLEIGNLANAQLTEVAYFDSYPENNSASFDGAWSNYPFFESGIIIMSDIDSGLFILQPDLD